MILHICIADKFIQPYITFVNENFNQNDHQFYVINKKNRFQFEPSPNLLLKKKLGFFGFIELMKLFRAADKVILHGLFRNRIVLLLALNFNDLKKCYWSIWGGDLYKYYERNKDIKRRFWHVIRKFVISRFGNFITCLPEDYKLAQKWYGAQGKYNESFTYLSNVYHPVASSQTSNSNEYKNILLGNSSTPANQHEDAFQKLLAFKGKIKIISPLSYGNDKYRAKIINLGHELFDKDFIPLTTFMPFAEYNQLLSGVDTVIFNHDRQQGMGNVIQLLGQGKKVFLNTSTPQYDLFKNMGIKVFDVNQIDLEPLDETSKENNQKIISQYFSKENLKFQLSNIFNSPVDP